jgi:BioD-like phosphotransacetylase family protein
VPTIVVTSSAAGEGKTGIAAAIARHYAFQGLPVRLGRIASDEPGTDADAAFFGASYFAPGSGSIPLSPDDVPSAAAGEVVVLEASPEVAAQLASAGAKVVLVARGAQPAKVPAGLMPVATIVTAARAASTSNGGSPTIVLAEDRTLAGFSLSELRAAIHTDVLVEGERDDPTCDYLVIAPIASDAGQPYFRRFPAAAVVVRFDRTDMHLAAMQAEPEVLVLTGGRRPSDYLFDAASSKGVPVLLARTDTENTVIALEGIFDRTRFQGERKLERMAALLEETPLWASLDS